MKWMREMGFEKHTYLKGQTFCWVWRTSPIKSQKHILGQIFSFNRRLKNAIKEEFVFLKNLQSKNATFQYFTDIANTHYGFQKMIAINVCIG